MAPAGLLMALVATFCWAISVFPFTFAGRLMSVSAMNIFRLIAATILVMIIAALVESNCFFGIFSFKYIHAWTWFGLSGILALGIGDYFNFRMYVILSPRYGSVLSTLSPAAALLTGYLLLNEQMNPAGIVGMAFTLVGVMSLSLGPTERNQIPDHGHGSILKGIVFGIIAAICIGAGLALSKKGFLTQEETGYIIRPITASFMRFFITMCVVLLITFFNKKLFVNFHQIKIQPWSVMKLALLGTIFGPLLGVSFALSSIQYIDVAVAQTIFSLVPVVAILIAHFKYKEKITVVGFAGVLASIIGVAILIWRDNIESIFL